FAGLYNGLPPVSVEWADEGDAGATYTRQPAEPLLQLAIENVQVIDGVCGKRRFHHNADPILDGEAKVLVFDIQQAMRQQAGSSQQREGCCGLQNNEGLAEARRTVAGGAIHAP